MNRLLILLVLTTLLVSCKTPRRLIKMPIQEQGTEYLFDKMKEHELKFSWLSAKFKATAIINENTTTIEGQVRIQKDSAIWISVSPALGIEVLRIYITNDSLKLINRLNKTYFITTFKHLNQLTNTDIDFDMLQALLLGNDFSYYENGETGKFRASIDKKQYHLSTSERRKLKKYIKENDSIDHHYIQNIWLDAKTFKITEQMVKQKKDVDDKRKLEISYTDFKVEGTQAFPHEIQFRIFDKDEPITINLSYSKIVLDEALSLPFKIPTKYTAAE